MNFVLKVIEWVYNFLTTVSIPVTVGTEVYNITFMAIFLFTGVVSIVVATLFYFFK